MPLGDAIAGGFLRGLRAGLSALPERAALGVGRALGWFYGSVIRHHRDDAFDALRRSLPGRPEEEYRRLVARVYDNLALNAVEVLRLRKGGETYVRSHVEVPPDYYETLRGVVRPDRGALVLTGHLGNWELLAAIQPLLGYPLNMIVKPIRGPGVGAFLNECRGVFGVKILQSRGSYRHILQGLHRGEMIGFVLDQNMTRNEGVFVDFFGRPACTTNGLAHLSARTAAPVVPIFMERLAGGRHRIHTGKPLPPPSDRSDEALRAATQAYTKVIEDYIRQHPDQWIWIHRRWRTVPLPAGAAPSPSAQATGEADA